MPIGTCDYDLTVIVQHNVSSSQNCRPVTPKGSDNQSSALSFDYRGQHLC
jgi:hypothetical protein